jgi:choline-sulfatase
MTGLYPSAIGLRSNNPARDVRVLPECITGNGLGTLLKRGGYHAVYGGKEHLPKMNAEALGFDYFCRDDRDGLADHCAAYIREYRDDKPFAMVASFINPHDICLFAISDFADECEYARRITDNQPVAVDSVRNAAKIPQGMNPTVFFDTLCPPLPGNHVPSPDEPEAIPLLQSEKNFKVLARERYTEEEWRLHRWAYAKLTESVDAQIGRVLDALIDSGRWDDTVIVFTSDHGDMGTSHKMEHKECLYQECIKVPLIVKGLSGKARGTVNDSLVSNGLDCVRTVMDYSGIEKPGYLTGVSLLPAAEGAPYAKREELVIEGPIGIAAMDGRHKYVRYDKGERNEQFYDLAVNSGEMYNQIEDTRYVSELRRLSDVCDSHVLRGAKASRPW